MELIWRKKGTIIIIIFIFLVLTFITTMLQPLAYGAKAKLLVIQNAPTGSDPYAIARSNAYLSVILSDIISTHSFYEEVMDGEFGSERRYFEKDDNIDKTLKKWKKALHAIPVGDTGVIEIQVVHENEQQAEKITEGVFLTLKNKHTLFHGMGENVQIKIIDPAMVYQKTPNMKLNFGAALALGVLVSLGYVSQYPEKEHDLMITRKR